MKTRVLALVLLAALSCAKQEEQPRALTKVRLNLNPTITYAPFVLAKEAGDFAAEGIDAEFVSLDPNSALLAATNGDLDVFSGGVRAGIFNMMRRGLPMRVVADKGHSEPGQCASEAFIAPPAMADRIAQNGGALRGERIAMVRGGITELLIERLLEARRTKASEVTFVDLPQGTSAAYRTNVDAIRYISDPHLTNAMHEGLAKIVATGEELLPGHQTTIMVYGKRLLRDDPALGRRFMRAYLRGVQRYNEGKTERNVAIISRYTKLDPEIVRRACWVTVASDGRIRPEAVQVTLEWARRRGYLDGEIRVEQWWDPSFLQ